MPSFFFPKRAHRGGAQVDTVPNSLDDGAVEKERRTRTRDYLRGLVKRASIPADFKPERASRSSQLLRNSDPHLIPLSPTPPIALSPMSPTSPKSPITTTSNSNKPLPRRPPPGKPEAEPPPKPAMKLARIITPIALDDLHRMFSGAPQFFARSECQHTGAPHPSVAFPWNSKLEVRDLTDQVQIYAEAWRCVTAWPHITLQTSRNQDAAEEHRRRQMAYYTPRCSERPNMLSMQGLERGTLGYTAALELGVADALHEPEGVSENGPQAISEHRRKFLNGKEGLRPLTDSALIDRLMSVSETYYEDSSKNSRPTVGLYAELFTQTLYPPKKVTDAHDPYSLHVQIEALVLVLAAPHVWFDFGLVEWRIRLGQILWGVSSEIDTTDQIAVNNEVMYEPDTQKYWLLFQILLSCELLLRLDAISMNMQETTPAELHHFDKEAKTSVRWSLILARQWLDNIRLARKDSETKSQNKPSTGWLASLKRNSGSEAEPKPAPVEGIECLKFEGRNMERQLFGLLHFAQELHWPNLDDLTSKVTANEIAISDSVQSTPAGGTPLSISTQRSSYFSTRHPRARRGFSAEKSVSALIRPAGWLSNTYLSGLVLPGEGLGHFLITTLLEHDEAAVEKLGDEANLYGGFIYGERSFWSTACIVGRVLAGRKGASECMGWISSDCLPQGIGEGWVDIEIEQDNVEKPKKPRLCFKTAIETDGNVIGGADTSSLLPGDFVVPSDESLQKPLAVTFESLDLFATTEELLTPLTDVTESSKVLTCSAMMRFIVQRGGEVEKAIDLNVSHDIHFVTAHPCLPSPHTEVLKSPTSPSFHTSPAGTPIWSRASAFPTISSTSNTLIASSSLASHPLHKGFTYSRVPLLEVLSTSPSLPFASILSVARSPDPTMSSTHTTSSSIPRVLVIDCTDSTSASQRLLRPHKHDVGSDLEVLARALCAERGWDALISRKGRGCISCAVREASALGWRVVLRLA